MQESGLLSAWMMQQTLYQLIIDPPLLAAGTPPGDEEAVVRLQGEIDMKQIVVALFLSVIGFGVTFAILHNDVVAGLVALVVLFLSFFWLCILTMARLNDDQYYRGKGMPSR